MCLGREKYERSMMQACEQSVCSRPQSMRGVDTLVCEVFYDIILWVARCRTRTMAWMLIHILFFHPSH